MAADPGPPSETGRIEAFSDGVIAIVITIMVLELKPPQHATLRELLRLWPLFLAYGLSFVQVGVSGVGRSRAARGSSSSGAAAVPVEGPPPKDYIGFKASREVGLCRLPWIVIPRGTRRRDSREQVTR